MLAIVVAQADVITTLPDELCLTKAAVRMVGVPSRDVLFSGAAFQEKNHHVPMAVGCGNGNEMRRVSM